MAAYIVFTKEREHDAAAMKTYAGMAGGSMAGHAGKPLAYYGAIETLEGPEATGSVIIEFPTVEEARAWYDSPAYQEARALRFQGGDYRVFITQGI
jgi:uncharacterized protein (DUF1330 family)